jgi:hypothetical protein
MHTRTTLATVALTLDFPTATANTGAANINAMFPHNAGDDTAALENPDIRYAATGGEFRCGTIQALAKNLP